MSAPERLTALGAELAIWREAPAWEGRRTAAVGAFACDDARAGAALLRQVAGRLRAEGFEAAVGPMDGDTWARHRLVVESDGRPPFLLEPANPAHHPDAFDAAGWSVIARYASAERDLAAPSAPNPDPPPLRVRTFDPARAEDELRRIHALSLEAFAGNFLYRPIGAEAFLDLYRPVLPAVDPEFVLLAETDAGDLQGFLFGVPDMAQGARPDAVILKTYASLRKGAGSMLSDLFTAKARDAGYTRVIHALFHRGNLSAVRSGQAGGRIFRRYALWGLRL